MLRLSARVFLLCALLTCVSVRAADSPLQALSHQELAGLIHEIDQFFTRAVEDLFLIQKDEATRALGHKVRDELLSSYDPRIAGRCTDSLTLQSFNQYVQALFARFQEAKAEDALTREKGEYERILAGHRLSVSDLAATDDCSVFEYDLESLYEGTFTAFKPRWLFARRHHIQTTIELRVVDRADPSVLGIEARIREGRGAGRYLGLAERDLHSETIRIELTRQTPDRLRLDGELKMAGNQETDALFGKPAPKALPRVLVGTLVLHDGSYSTQNQVRLVAREANEKIAANLAGFTALQNERMGDVLNLIVVEIRGPQAGAKASEISALISKTYSETQTDNPVQSFHPALGPALVSDNDLSFVLLDTSTDLNSEVVAKLRSDTTLGNLAGEGFSVEVLPFYKIGKGTIGLKFASRPESETEFSGFSGLVRGMLGMLSAANQEQANVFSRAGVTELSAEIQSLQNKISERVQAIGPEIDTVLSSQSYSEAKDKKLTAEMDVLLGSAREVNARLGAILGSDDEQGLRKALDAYLASEKAVLLTASEGDQVHARAVDDPSELLRAVNGLLDQRRARAAEIGESISYLRQYGIDLTIDGEVIDAAGKLKKTTWHWQRKLPAIFEKGLTGRLQ